MPVFTQEYYPQGAKTPELYSITARDENVSDADVLHYIEQSRASGKTLFDTDNGPIMVSSPAHQEFEKQYGGVLPSPFQARQAYELNVGAPIARGLDKLTANPAIQAGVGYGLTSGDPGVALGTQLSGQTPTMPQAQQVGQGALSASARYVKSITDDPAMLALLGVTSAASMATGAGLFTQLAPNLTSRIFQIVGMPVLGGATYGAVGAATNPDDPGRSLNEGAKLAGLGIGVNLAFAGFGSLLNSKLDPKVRDAMLARLDKALSEQGATAELLRTNPEKGLEQIAKVFKETANNQAQATSERILSFVKQHAPEHYDTFASQLTNIQSKVSELAGMKSDTVGYAAKLEDLQRSLDVTAKIALGTAKGPITNPSDSMLAYHISRDPEAMALLARSGALSRDKGLMTSWPNTVGTTKLEEALLKPNADGVPLFRQYLVQSDIDRILTKINPGFPTGEYQKSLDTWKQGMTEVLKNAQDLAQGTQIIDSLTKRGITNAVDMRRSALEIAQEYNNTGKVTDSLIQAIYNTEKENIPLLSFNRPIEVQGTGLGANLAKGTGAVANFFIRRQYGSPTGVQAFTPWNSPPISVSAGQLLKGYESKDKR